MEPVESKITVQELHDEGALFLAAGKRYWEVMQRAGMGGAISWIKDTEGFGVLFTRGEYTEILLQNIHRTGPTHHFGCMSDE